jgi:hypothetical protein
MYIEDYLMKLHKEISACYHYLRTYFFSKASFTPTSIQSKSNLDSSDEGSSSGILVSPTFCNLKCSFGKIDLAKTIED